MVSAEWALQQAIHGAISGDAAMAGHLGSPVRLYDNRPEELIYPYATYGRCQGKPVAADPGDGWELIQHLHVWSRYGGRREAKQIVGAIRDVLHLSDLTLVDWRLVLLRVAFVDVFRGADGFTSQGVVRLRARLDPIGVQA